MKKTAHDWLNEYGESHKNPINKGIHWICVPLIMLSLISLLSLIPIAFNINISNQIYRIDLSIIFLFFASIYYFKLSKTLFIGMIFISFGLIYGIQVLKSFPYPLGQLSTAIFVFAWIGQFIGHKIEGVKPSFFKEYNV